MEKLELKLSDPGKQGKAERVFAGFHLSEDVGEKIYKVYEKEMEQGLKDGLKSSSLLMENTYVPELINGSEDGKFLALDLGGTNFRVMLLVIEKGKITKEKVSYYSVSEPTRLGPGEALFDFLAECIHDFVQKNGLSETPLPLGFTFSFPMEQKALDVGILVTWTKSFNCPGVVGTDAALQLTQAMKRQGKLKVEVVAIMNDTTGTLVRGAYDDPRTAIGLILGTGCNGAYLEQSERVIRWGDGERKADDKEVIVDPEFGAFGDNGCLDFIKTKVDKEVDKASLLPGSFTFEKHFSGKYIGEVARRTLLSLKAEGAFCAGSDGHHLGEEGSFHTSDISAVEEDTVKGEDEKCKEIGKRLGLDLSPDDISLLKHICALLTHRGAFLVGIVLGAMLRRMSRPGVSAIAVTGSLYKFHPRFRPLLEKYTEAYAGENKFVTFLSDDGSGKGAGLVAAIADRIRKRNNKN